MADYRRYGLERSREGLLVIIRVAVPVPWVRWNDRDVMKADYSRA